MSVSQRTGIYYKTSRSWADHINHRTLSPFFLAITKRVVIFFVSVAVHFSKQHFLYAALNNSILWKLGAPKFEPGAAGWEAQTLLLCYSAHRSGNGNFWIMVRTHQIKWQALDSGWLKRLHHKGIETMLNTKWFTFFLCSLHYLIDRYYYIWIMVRKKVYLYDTLNCMHSSKGFCSPFSKLGRLKKPEMNNTCQHKL